MRVSLKDGLWASAGRGMGMRARTACLREPLVAQAELRAKKGVTSGNTPVHISGACRPLCLMGRRRSW